MEHQGEGRYSTLLWLVLAMIMVRPSDGVLSGVAFQMVRAVGPESLLGFTPIEQVRSDLGDIGHLTSQVDRDLGGVRALTDLTDVQNLGQIGHQLDHMNTLLETSLGAREVERLADLSDIANIKDIGPGINTFDSFPRKRRRGLLCSHPETSLPAMTGMTQVPVLNVTINVQTSCHLPFGSYFRQVDGTCNNPENLGAAMKPITRVLPAAYQDGFQTPRMFGVTGRPLPSPRVVSRHIHTDQARASQFTIMLMQWGQFMDHDMVSTPLPIEDTRETITCCGPNKTLPLGDEDPECFPIFFHSDRSFIGQCMEFVRSMPLMDDFGQVKLPRENMNAVTSFIDASTVYGSSEEVLKEMRDKHGLGYLFKLDNGKPIDNGKEDCIKREGREDICYLAGDERVNEHAGLTAIHTVFMRLHNQWATKMRRMVPWWPDEVIFEKTRAIVVGVVQKVMFNEWLPIILGRETAVRSGLYTPEGHRTQFNEAIDPSVFSAFSTAVFRFGHTLIPKELFLGGSQRTKLRDLFFKPYLLFEAFDEICTNLVSGFTDDDRSQEYDRHITEEVTNHLFENDEGHMKGFDLISVNLQRGRDHGIPPYNDFREFCGLHRVTSFDDPALGESGRLFADVYEHPDDIELFTGGISEPSHLGGLLGETFSCLMVNQMTRAKFGDRYFFSHNRGTHGFSAPQLKEIHKYTLSHLMCETTKMDKVQMDAFTRPGYDNPMVSCDYFRKNSLNLQPFTNIYG